jgi:hypothetical protein
MQFEGSVGGQRRRGKGRRGGLLAFRMPKQTKTPSSLTVRTKLSEVYFNANCQAHNHCKRNESTLGVPLSGTVFLSRR